MPFCDFAAFSALKSESATDRVTADGITLRTTGTGIQKASVKIEPRQLGTLAFQKIPPSHVGATRQSSQFAASSERLADTQK